MKNVIKKSVKALLSVLPGNSVTGFVEQLSYDAIEGWAIDKNNAKVEVELVIGLARYSLRTEWHNRSDVSESLGEQHSHAGFTAALPLEVQKQLRNGSVASNAIKIVANKRELKVLTLIPEKVDILVPEVIPNDQLNKSSAIQITNWGYFQISGVANLIKDDQTSITFKVNDAFFEQKLHFTKNDARSSNDEPDYFFEIELPGYVWEYADTTNKLDIIPIIGGDELLLQPLSIDQQKALDWLEAISSTEDNQEKQYLSLVAIEHLRYSALLKLLPKKAQTYFSDFAEKMGLSEFLVSADVTEQSGSPASHQTHVDYSTLALWAAQRDLNKRMADKNVSVFEHVVATKESLNLNGAVLMQYWKSVIPSLCQHGQLHQLKQVVNFSRFNSFEESNETWILSIAIPILVLEGHIQRAIDVVYKIIHNSNSTGGWISTECVLSATKYLLLDEFRGEVPLYESEGFRYALIELIDSFKGDWFSRLHDKMLLDSVITILQNSDRFTSYHRKDMINGALRNYGLSPAFWVSIDDSTEMTSHASIVNAKQAWSTVQKYLETPVLEETSFVTVRQALSFFERIGNKEAKFFEKEILNHALAHCGNVHELYIDEAFAASNSKMAMELVRVAASPLTPPQKAEEIVQKYGLQIRESLRLNTDKRHSMVLRNQQAISKVFERISSSITLLRDEELSKEITHIYNLLTPIRGSDHVFQDVDILTTLLFIVEARNNVFQQVLNQLDSAIQRAIDLTDKNSYLSAPVCTALAKLKDSTRSEIKSLVGEKTRIIEDKFLDSYSGVANLNKDARLCNISFMYPKDTLVVIYSCRAYLDSRIKEIRNTWLKDLDAKNIPYVIVVGDGDDKINGDVLELDVSDIYEDLPKKTLKMFDWIAKNTNAQYVLKIDDDCSLNVDAYFNNQSYRKFHYYGRILHRQVGNMDRAWHQEKSKTIRAQKSIDKSPEPATYADGGGGYTLSRYAMHCLLKNVDTAKGTRLVADSFMEDKLVGDLLVMSNIWPEDEDYQCYQRRRTFGKAMPVAMWENIFYPSKSTPTVVTHLDNANDQAFAFESKGINGLFPKKIWPSCFDTSIRLNSNQLELISSDTSLQRLATEELVVIAVVRNEMIMLPHFLKHYRDLGVTTFILADNCSDDGTREFLYKQPDVILYSVDTEYKHSYYGVAWQQAILSNHCLGKWVLIADADELLVFPNMENKSLLDYVKKVESQGYDCVRTDMVDMYPYGNLADADFTVDEPFNVANWHDKEPLHEWRLGSGQYSNGISSVSSLRHRLDPNAEPNAFTSQKYALIKYKPWMRFSQGIHDATGVKKHPDAIRFAHFKYHSGFQQKVQDEIRRKQHYGNAQEYQRYASMLAEVDGEFGCEEISVEFCTS